MNRRFEPLRTTLQQGHGGASWNAAFRERAGCGVEPSEGEFTANHPVDRSRDKIRAHLVPESVPSRDGGRGPPCRQRDAAVLGHERAVRNRLGAVRLGELGVLGHRDLGVLSAVPEAVLGKRRRCDDKHVPARPRERRGRYGRRGAFTDARRNRGPGWPAQALPRILHGPRDRDDGRTAVRRARRLAARHRALRDCRNRLFRCDRLLRRADRRRREPAALASGLRAGLCAWATSAADCCSRSTSP